MRDRADDIPLAARRCSLSSCAASRGGRAGGRTEVVLDLPRGGAVATVGYELALLQRRSRRSSTRASFLVNRPTLALVAVGVTAATALSGILWTSFGLRRRDRASLVVVAHRGGAVPAGPRAAMVFDRRGRRVPDVRGDPGRPAQRACRTSTSSRRETQRLARGEDLARRTTRRRARHRAQRPVDRHATRPTRSTSAASRGCSKTWSSCAARSGSRQTTDDPDRRRRGRQPAQRDHAHGQRLPVARPQHPCHRIRVAASTLAPDVARALVGSVAGRARERPPALGRDRSPSWS